MHTPTNFLIKDGDIRREFDEKSGTWQYSVVDTMGVVSGSADPRNYWKVLKSRLKKSSPELVTACNQLKLLSPDGKYYLTDTADSETMLAIIRHVSPPHVRVFRRWFEEIEGFTSKNIPEDTGDIVEISTGGLATSAELAIDAYVRDALIVVTTFVPGVIESELAVTATYKTLKISGKRKRHNLAGLDHMKEEIYWGQFEREVELPHSVDVDEVEATLSLGILTVHLPRIDIERTRTIKIKSL